MILTRFVHLTVVGGFLLLAAGIAVVAGADAQSRADARSIDDAQSDANARSDADTQSSVDAQSGADARSIDDARIAFEEGRFLEAADLAEALGTSVGYALAAQSLAVHGHYVAASDDRKGFFERAMKLGEEAVRADSTNQEAYYQSAHAVGRYALTVGTFTALRRGLAGRVRGLLENALAMDPDFADAHMAFGGWHAGIARAGRVARFLYKGNRESAVIHFERALELAPDSMIVLLEYALNLPELDREGGRERAVALLSKAAGLPARDAFESFIQQDVLEALAELEGPP
ncbi:MAG: hypothetical protein F4Y38_12165 [Gemmatimonadetes bacterium]|nr:hypothetical protein [Gemmatimonadota bacterium]MYG86808.1 hypothetical protein [Gemmatimonadota bacterium]MYJ88425.1 hypothetical protein [Gemmatimonadota bacterium]